MGRVMLLLCEPVQKTTTDQMGYVQKGVGTVWTPMEIITVVVERTQMEVLKIVQTLVPIERTAVLGFGMQGTTQARLLVESTLAMRLK